MDSYAALGARVQRLRRAMAEVAPRVEALREERAELVARISAGALDESEWPRADALNDFVSSLESQGAELSSLEEMVGEVTFDARVEVERLDAEWLGGRPQTSVRETPTYRAGAKPSRREIVYVEESELTVAELRWRAASLERPREHRLVRVIPATRAPESRELASWLAWALYRVVDGFGATVTLLEHDGARWVGDAADKPRGWAVAIEGYGLDAVLDGELGFHLAVRHEGPDVRTGLARVEVVEAGSIEGDERAPTVDASLAHLEALDAELAAFEEARRRGEPGPHPRGPLPIVRRVVDGVGVDPTSGVTITEKGLESLQLAIRTRLALREDG